jgi:DNA-binding LytR/AlgR family response regulator
MIELLIIEDEIPARKKVMRFVEELNLPVKIMAEIDNVQSGILFLKNNKPDLILSDIELIDGNSFEIFSETAVECPIIFITAYDKFWMHAFETNGIDYLMKPFTKERFKKAWDKYVLLRNSQTGYGNMIENITRVISMQFTEKNYRKRFAIHTKQAVLFLDVRDIAYFEATDGLIFAFDKTAKKHLLSFTTLKELELQLNSDDFFRLNRSEVISRQYIEKLERVSKNVLGVKMKGFNKLLIASQSNAAQLRSWIDQ